MAASASLDRQTFLDRLGKSGLVSPEELAALADRLPITERAGVVAKALVEQGVLTRFQAERLLAGRTSGFILRQYRILDQLGKGGMGRVYKALHQTMNRIVALKVLSPQLMETERAQKLFLREMQAVARLSHPNLVTAYDADHKDNRYYLVMEYVEGPNLQQLVRERGPLPAGLACELIRQAANGLQYASDMGMVHRDVKPSNLLVLLPDEAARRKHYVLRILDFGLARLQRPEERPSPDSGTILTQPDSIMGTPDFLSPEQARDLHSVDIRSDLYSLGCTFYYLLTGDVPFPDGTTFEKLVRHATREPTPVEQLRPEVSMAVGGIVRRLMAKNPADRFQTPADVSAALESLADEEASAWSSTKLPVVAAEVLVTPVPAGDGSSTTPLASDDPFDFDVSLPAAEDVAALVSTVPPDLSPTPLPVTRYVGTIRMPNSATAADRRRLRLAVGLATGIVVGGLIVLALIFGLR
jgi:serine/threonine protein kinase